MIHKIIIIYFKKFIFGLFEKILSRLMVPRVTIYRLIYILIKYKNYDILTHFLHEHLVEHLVKNMFFSSRSIRPFKHEFCYVFTF